MASARKDTQARIRSSPACLSPRGSRGLGTNMLCELADPAEKQVVLEDADIRETYIEAQEDLAKREDRR